MHPQLSYHHYQPYYDSPPPHPRLFAPLTPHPTTNDRQAMINNNLTTTSNPGATTYLAAGGTMMPLTMMRNRQPAQIIAAVDGVFAVVLLVFHGLTLMVQEMPETETKSKDNFLLPRVPMTPGELNITGYMEVIAWIGILSVNFLQLLVAVGLFNASDKKSIFIKAFEASQVWLKTCIFLLCILLIKLCILYFMYEMNMRAGWTIFFTSIETLFHFVGLVIVFKFYDEIKRNNPMATSQSYRYHASLDDDDDENSSPKRNNVADAVWF